MTTNALTLNDLRDIVVPDPVPFWPPAPGWFLLLAASLFIAIVWGWRARKKWRATAPYRDALQRAHQAKTPDELAEILRRVAFFAQPRATVIELHGAAWLDWFATEFDTPLPDSARAALASVYSGADADVEALRAYVDQWIREVSC